MPQSKDRCRHTIACIMAAQILSSASLSGLHSASARSAVTPVVQLSSAPKRVPHFASPPQWQQRVQNAKLHAILAPEVWRAHLRTVCLSSWLALLCERLLLHSVRKLVQALQAETATTAVPDLDYDALAEEFDRKSPLEIIDHVRLPHPFYRLLLFPTSRNVLQNGMQLLHLLLFVYYAISKMRQAHDVTAESHCRHSKLLEMTLASLSVAQRTWP